MLENVNADVFVLASEKLIKARDEQKISGKYYLQVLLDYNIALYYQDVSKIYQIIEKLARFS